jgi:hypothetical protein
MITMCFQPNVITERNLNANRFGILWKIIRIFKYKLSFRKG